MDKVTQLLLFGISLCCLLIAVNGVSTVPTTTPTPEEVCGRLNGSCEQCVSAPKAKCYYCQTDGTCRKYPAKEILPNKECELSKARWGVCWVNFEALIITMSVFAGILLIGVPCGIYCCCCRSGGNRAKWAREDARIERQKEERSMRHEQKKAERKAKNDEIRRKYGLLKNEEDSDSLYAEDV